MSEPLPEVHIIGEILHGHQFSSCNAFAKFDIESSDKWDCVGGEESGQTQVDYPKMVCAACYLDTLVHLTLLWLALLQLSSKFVWNHPIDLHYFIQSMQGWPKMVFQVGSLDEYGGKQVFGYGVVHLPTCSGMHEMECPIWRVVGSTLQEAYAFFLNIKPQLRDTKLICETAHQHRNKICTVSVGSIKMRLAVLFRNFNKFDLEWK